MADEVYLYVECPDWRARAKDEEHAERLRESLDDSPCRYRHRVVRSAEALPTGSPAIPWE